MEGGPTHKIDILGEERNGLRSHNSSCGGGGESVSGVPHTVCVRVLVCRLHTVAVPSRMGKLGGSFCISDREKPT